MSEELDNVIVLVDEDGQEVEFEHIDTIEMDESTYLVLLPVIQEDEESSEVVIMKLEEGEGDDDDTLVLPESEEEVDKVFNEFKVRHADEFDIED